MAVKPKVKVPDAVAMPKSRRLLKSKRNNVAVMLKVRVVMVRLV